MNVLLFTPLVIFFGAFLLFLIVLLFKSVYLVQQAETIVVERLGRYHRTLGPGLHIIVPFFEAVRSVAWTFLQLDERGRHIRVTQIFKRIDLRESVYDFPKQNVITKDNVTTEINALLYYQITDPRAAIYEVFNLPEAIEKLTQTTLRNIIGSMDLDETLVSRDQINEQLRIILDDATDKWGVKVNRVELQEVNPPLDIRHAMEKQMRAERERREMMILSEGKKRSAILEAEGARESQVLYAKGQAESKVLQAEGEATARLKKIEAEAQAIDMIKRVMHEGADPIPYMVSMEYMKTLPEMTKGVDDKLVIIPYEASAMIGAVSAMKKVFQEVK